MSYLFGVKRARKEHLLLTLKGKLNLKCSKGMGLLGFLGPRFTKEQCGIQKGLKCLELKSSKGFDRAIIIGSARKVES